MTRQDAMQCADRCSLIPGTRTAQAMFQWSMDSKIIKRKPTGESHGPRSITGSRVGLDTRGQVSRNDPSRLGSFLTLSSTQQTRRIGTDLPASCRGCWAQGQRDRGRVGAKAVRCHRTCPIHCCQLFPSVLPMVYLETEACKDRSVCLSSVDTFRISRCGWCGIGEGRREAGRV